MQSLGLRPLMLRSCGFRRGLPMFRSLCSRSTTIGVALLLFLLLIASAHAPGIAAAGSISLRPPFNGTYRLTSFFDHYYPNYAAGPDGRITIYTGENVADQR